MPRPVRVRFPPSPTGYMHLGGLRTALFNYLFARHTNGTFILRIEDTDRERLIPEAVQHITDSLNWLGLTPDESPDNPNNLYGPYVQSERLKLYSDYAKELLKKDYAYKDFSTSERLSELRTEAQAAKKPFRFTEDMAQLKPAQPDDPYVIRFHIQPGGDVVWQDAVWGEQRWQRGVLDDFVAIKSDGYPTYNFANVIDDHLMEISHVFRGAEFLSTTPKNLLVYEAFRWEPPIYAHLPPVLGPDKAKLSKRHGAKSALEYRDAGYLPEAIVNYLASLGFNDGTTQEVYTRDELINAFSLDRIQSSPAVFDGSRLDWMSGLYIRQLSIDELAGRAKPFWPKSAEGASNSYKLRVLGLVQERLKFLAELGELTEFFFVEPKVDPNLLPKQLGTSRQKQLLALIVNELERSDFSEADIERRLRGLVSSEQIKPGHLFGLIRVAITGQTAAPGLFETLATLGKQESLKRLRSVNAQL